MVPYVVDAVTVMHVLLFFVACVYAARVTAMVVWGPGEVCLR